MQQFADQLQQRIAGVDQQWFKSGIFSMALASAEDPSVLMAMPWLNNGVEKKAEKKTAADNGLVS